MRAAIIRNLHDAPEIVDGLQLEDTPPGMVRIAIEASGVCHTDLSFAEGAFPHPVPFVLGHEGAGRIIDVGRDVRGLAVGDHVILAPVPPCGACRNCLRGSGHLCTVMRTSPAMTSSHFLLDGAPVWGMTGTGTFVEETLAVAQAAVPIPKDVPFDVACLIGCGVSTGVGAALNVAEVQPGSSVIVFGCGGVGMSVVQGARIAGAAEIVAIDTVESKRSAATGFGATHVGHPDDVAGLLRELTDGDGFDYAFEAVGRPETIMASWAAARRGGTVCVVGMARPDATVTFNAQQLLLSSKRLVAAVRGEGDVRNEFQKLVRLWRAGRLDVAGMVTTHCGLDDVGAAFTAMRDGVGLRTVITL